MENSEISELITSENQQLQMNNEENKQQSFSELTISAIKKFTDDVKGLLKNEKDPVNNDCEVNNVPLIVEKEMQVQVHKEQEECMDVDEIAVVADTSNNDGVLEKDDKVEVRDKEGKEIDKMDQVIELQLEQKDVTDNEQNYEQNLSINEEQNKIHESNGLLTNNNESNENQEPETLSYNWTVPKLISLADKEFKPTKTCENFTKGCLWSPDGTCILVPSEDFKIRLFELPRELYSGVLPKDFKAPSLESTLRVKEGGTVYDTCWFPYMSSWDPSTCCFLSTSQGSPIHLWDAFTGLLRATYRAYNQVDEVEAAVSVQFTECGGQIWSGFKNALRIFDTDRPGRQIKTIYLKKDFPNITGLVSCIRENPQMPGLVAFGTYSKYIGLYKDGPLCSFQTDNGVTQIEFSPCGTKLYSSVRRGSEFLCWDLRNPGTVLYSLGNRQSDTNQRIHFSLSYNGEEIVSGGTDGAARVWQIPSDIQVNDDLDPKYKIKISKDCVNGVDLHKNLPILAVSTGCRICDEEEEDKYRDNSLRFYWLSSR